MIELARRRTANSPRVRFFHEDARTVLLPEARYDALVTPFFLDCFTAPDLRDLVAKLARSATPEALWLVTDFALPHRGCPARREPLP